MAILVDEVGGDHAVRGAHHVAEKGRWVGVGAATARIALVDDARSSQAPYVDATLLPQPGTAFSRQVMRQLERDLAARYDLAIVARTAGVSTRTLLRRFGAETG